MTVDGAELVDLPEDSESLKAVVRSLLEERDREKRRAEEQQRRAEEQKRRAEGQRLRAEELHIEMLRLEQELERYKKWYYGPRADRLQSSGDLAQMLLDFAAELDRKPVHPGDLPSSAEPAEELRRVRRRKGRRNLANFENLPVTTHVHYLHEAGIRDFAGHAVGLVRRCSGSGRAALRVNGGAGAGLARGGHR